MAAADSQMAARASFFRSLDHESVPGYAMITGTGRFLDGTLIDSISSDSLHIYDNLNCLSHLQRTVSRSFVGMCKRYFYGIGYTCSFEGTKILEVEKVVAISFTGHLPDEVPLPVYDLFLEPILGSTGNLRTLSWAVSGMPFKGLVFADYHGVYNGKPLREFEILERRSKRSVWALGWAEEKDTPLQKLTSEQIQLCKEWVYNDLVFWDGVQLVSAS